MIKYYKLNKKGVPVPSNLMGWADRMTQGPPQVSLEMVGDSIISTVFLGLDNQFGEGPPILWETMVFGGKLDQEQDRCSGTKKDALAMHKRMVNRVKGTL